MRTGTFSKSSWRALKSTVTDEKKNPLYGKLPRCKIHYFVDWTCPTTLSPLLGYPLMPQLLVSPSLPPNSGLLRQNTTIHLTEGEFIMNNWRHFSKTFLSNAESWKSSLCGRCRGFSCLRETTARVFKRDLNLVALSPCPLENTKYSNPKSRLKIADNDSQCHS